MQQTLPVAERFTLSQSAEAWQLRADAPHACGYSWRLPAASSRVILLHGLQSHSQWFAETGPLLKERGLDTYALDRRGSGSSPGLRGDIGDYRDWFAEVDGLVQTLRSDDPQKPIHLIGHCFGANIALAMPCRSPTRSHPLSPLPPAYSFSRTISR